MIEFTWAKHKNRSRLFELNFLTLMWATSVSKRVRIKPSPCLIANDWKRLGTTPTKPGLLPWSFIKKMPMLE